MAEKILLVEDEEKLARMVELELRYEGYEVEKAFDGRTGLERALSGGFDLVLLDIMLPALSGMEVLRRLRQEGNSIPVLILTAKGEVEDKVLGLDSGANDYLTKPFATEELLARLRAITRQSVQLSSQLTFGNLSLEQTTFELSTPAGSFRLANKEYQMMELFLRNPNRVFSRTSLLDQVWGYEYQGDDRTVDVHIRRLREKIEVNPSEPKFVHTKWGVGYYFQG